MATEWFKTKLATWLKITVSERLVYITCTCVTLMFVIIQWQSIPETYLWFINTQQHSLLWLFFFLLHLVGWFLLVLQVLLVDFGELVGVHQVYQYHNLLSPPLAKSARKLTEIYSHMRHPGAVLLTAMLWVHPLMTLDRVILACTLTSYVIGRHSFDQSHYEFAEKYFTTLYSEKGSRSSVRYEHVHSN
uniref:Nuclear envelope membrane protein n=1 Tax=Arion vulgaris TaxID=1028688 RepID=A0A0B6ZYX2_9EUPU